MNYWTVLKSLQEVLRGHVPLMPAQTRRIAMLCVAILLAGEVQLSRIARQLPQRTQRDSRIRWIQRLFSAPFIRPEQVYHPLLKVAFQTMRDPDWHLIIDRTAFQAGTCDLVTISLNYRKRAIPLIWCEVPVGGAGERVYTALVRQSVSLIPPDKRVIFHGDSEFSSGGMVRTLRELGWDFFLAQMGNWQVYLPGSATSCSLSTIPVKKQGCVIIAGVELYKKRFSGLTLLAFRQTHRLGKKVKREVCYLITTLPASRNLKRVGRRRWGTEPFYRDYKSAGFRMTTSQLYHPQRRASLLTLLAVCYLWAVCLGRWLTKTGRRREVDAKRRRHYSYFRIGWDWLIHHLRCDLPCPAFLRLYS